jgi:hypothetical protein
LVGIVGRLLEPPIVEDEHLGLGIFEIEFAVIGAFKAAGQVSTRCLAIEADTIEERRGLCGHGSNPGFGRPA